jgi:hypothetical protein
MTRIHRDTLINICIALGSVTLLLWVVPVYSPPHPGYGASPLLVPSASAAIILVIAVLALARNAIAYFFGIALSPEEREYPAEGQLDGFSQLGRIGFGHLARILIPCALFVLAMEWIGFIPAGIAFMLVIQYLCGQRKLAPAVTIGLGAVFLLYVAMRFGLGVTLPGA